MTTAMLTEPTISSGVLPSAIEDVCLRHDATCERIHLHAASIERDLSGSLTSEDRHELMAAVQDVASQLNDLYQAKLDAGLFSGIEASSPHCQERLAHMKFDYRGLLNELRRIEHEIASGKPRKAQRQLAHWLNLFTDVLDRESNLINELWSFDALVA